MARNHGRENQKGSEVMEANSVAVFVSIIFLILSFFAGLFIGTNSIKEIALDINHAYYDSKTREFKWNICEVTK